MKINRRTLSELVADVIREEEDYQKYFQAMLKKHGVSSPADFKTDAEKKEFFNAVDKNWKEVSERIGSMREVADSETAPPPSEIETPIAEEEVEALPDTESEPFKSDTLQNEIQTLTQIGEEIDAAIQNLQSIKEKWVAENRILERKRMKEMRMKKENLTARKESLNKQLAVKETNSKINTAIQALESLRQPVTESIIRIARKRK
jgi:hypothetical protein